jgi:hypothetical protein
MSEGTKRRVRDAVGVAALRLVTYASLEDQSPSSYSVALRHVARLPDGREVVLLDDRGFGGGTTSPEVVWTREQVELDARTCVGPDEPVGRQTRDEVDRWHREVIAQRLQAAGVAISADEVSRLEHAVVLDERLTAAVA